jgi:hypothetical protein
MNIEEYKIQSEKIGRAKSIQKELRELEIASRAFRQANIRDNYNFGPIEISSGEEAIRIMLEDGLFKHLPASIANDFIQNAADVFDERREELKKEFESL